METAIVYSPIYDKDIKKNVVDSPIWKEAYHEDEVRPDQPMYVYHIKFEGLKPIQVSKEPDNEQDKGGQ